MVFMSVSKMQMSLSDFVRPSTTGVLAESVHGKHIVKLLVGTDSAYFEWQVPSHFYALTTAKVLSVPTTTGTFDWTANTTFGAAGDDEAANSDTTTANGAVSTDDELTSTDISAAFTGIVANQIVGVEFVLDALDTTTEINVIGLELKFTSLI